MTSPACQVKDGAGSYVATANGVDVTPSNTVTINLISSAGVSTWSITCITTDELSNAATVTSALSVNSVAKTATFTAPVAGRAYRFQSTINGGIGPDGVYLPAYTTTFCVYTKTADDFRVGALDETFESNTTNGWTAAINELIRNGGGGGSATVNDDIAKSAGSDIDRVRGIRGVAISGSDGAPSVIGASLVYNAVGGGSYKRKKPTPPDWYDVTDYGADPTGATYSDAAFVAAIAAMGPAPTPSPSFTPEAWRGATLYVPSGTYKFASTLVLNRSIHLLGAGDAGGQYSQCVFLFDKGITGIRIPAPAQDPAGGRGDYVHVERLALYSGTFNWTTPSPFPYWQASHTYAVGAIVVPTEVTFSGYALRAKTITTGTTGATEPAWPTGTTVAAPTAGDTYADSGVTWEVIYAHAIEVRSQFVRIENVVGRRFPGNGIDNVASYSSGSLASLNYYEHNQFDYNGGHGAFFFGDDSNVCLVQRNSFTNNRGFGLHDKSFLGITAVANHTSVNYGGTPYWCSNGDYVGNYAEGGQGAIVLDGTGVTWMGGILGAGEFDGFSDRYRKPWSAGATIAVGDTRRPTADNGYYYYAQSITTGLTHATTEPTWPIGAGKIVVDNGVTWRCYGFTRVGAGTALGYNGRNVRVESLVSASKLVSYVGNHGTTPTAFAWSWYDPADSTEKKTYAIEYDSSGDWKFNNVSSGQTAMFLTTGTGNWPSYGAGYAAFARGFILGGGGGGYCRMFGGSAAPGGTWVQGDTVINVLPTAGAPIGWRCISAPSTWEAIMPADGAAVAMGALDIDWSKSHSFTKTLAAGANTFTFSNVAAGKRIMVRVTGATSTLTWPTVKWAGGTPPTQTSAGTDVYELWNDGTATYGSIFSANAS